MPLPMYMQTRAVPAALTLASCAFKPDTVNPGFVAANRSLEIGVEHCKDRAGPRARRRKSQEK